MKQSIHFNNKNNNKTINSQFNKIATKKKLTGWLMRQYFDPKQHSKAIWYDKSINETNVLEFVSDPKTRFPLTPAKITDLFLCIQSFKKNLKKSEKELGLNLGLPKKEEETLTETSKYQTGEVTLQKIGQMLGGLTPTMINKLATSGFDKIRKMSSNVSLDALEDEVVDDLNQFITQCRLEAAEEYADELITYKGHIKTFIERLVKRRVMTSNEMTLIENNEVAALMLLSNKSKDEIIKVLLNDITRDFNLFKSYQSAVSRKAFPEKKRGRQKKQVGLLTKEQIHA